METAMKLARRWGYDVAGVPPDQVRPRHCQCAGGGEVRHVSCRRHSSATCNFLADPVRLRRPLSALHVR